MDPNRNAPTVGQTEQGALIKNHTVKATHNSPNRQRQLTSKQSTDVMAGMYAALNNAPMVTVDTAEARRAVTGFVDAWQESRAAFKADRDDTGMAYLRKAATHANAVLSLYAHIHIGGVK